MRRFLILAALAATGVGYAVAGAPVAHAAEPCANDGVRAQSNVNPTTGKAYSLGLPGCRAYEKVSPLEKGGYDATLWGRKTPVANDGGRISFWGLGLFGDVPGTFANGEGFPYQAVRSGDGWTTSPWISSAALLPQQMPTTALQYAADGTKAVQCASPGPNGNTLDSVLRCTVRTASGAETFSDFPVLPRLGQPDRGLESRVEGASPDLSHVLVRLYGQGRLTESDTTAAGGALYDLVGLGGPAPTAHLINVDDRGTMLDGFDALLGGVAEPVNTATDANYHAVSQRPNGDTVVYFTVRTGNPLAPTSINTRIYARVNNATTFAVSDPSPAECTTCDPTNRPGLFQAASDDGATAYFLTSQQLVDTDTDEGQDLYAWHLDRPSGRRLTQVSGGGDGDPTPGTGAGVQGVVRTSSDGSRAFFVAAGVLTTMPNAAGAYAREGARNLYAFDARSASTTFVAQLCTGNGLSGIVNDSRCGADASQTDAGLWSVVDADRPAQTTGDGRYLVFATYAKLLPDDTDDASDVYRYDAVTGDLHRISIGTPSASTAEAQHGNTAGMNATIATNIGPNVADGSTDTTSRQISVDGTKVLFLTAEPLQGDDVNGGSTTSQCFTNVVIGDPLAGCDLYLWDSGSVAMISDGHDPYGINQPAINSAPLQAAPTMTPNGKSIFFTTRTALVGQDTDKLGDVYVARVDGGFAYSPPEGPCRGEACQGPLVTPPAAGLAASAAFVGPGNVSPPAAPKAKTKTKKLQVKQPKTVHGTSTRIQVRVPGKGKLRTSGSGLRRSHKTAKKAGTYRVSVRLSKRAQRTLRRKHRVKVLVTVRFAPAKGKKQRVRVHVTFRPKAKKHHRSSSRSQRRAHVLSSEVRKER